MVKNLPTKQEMWVRSLGWKISGERIGYSLQYSWASLVAQDGKESTCNVGDLGLIPGEGNGYPFQYSGLENSMDRGAWRATAHGGRKEARD